ncbi:uncharacterized protein LTR77_003879 [Saxophila tyrrhenica]|uniref:Peptidase S33 tripeptidyl aminopeptidase-like C-terminal domain-containing protein n=1 Tax=Saxophila tyrrhenica TaxID=1690608 RepID=A0AAV9PHV9_9PEZI|nr:hypothetical protein LTR77_003879 [Saxophila tyrrhenica]
MSLFIFSAALGLFATAGAVRRQAGQTGIDFQPCQELNNNITRINGVEGTTFECATLNVPLDYTDLSSRPLELDLFRVPATEEPVLGSVLINFGGPGGTGAENLPAYAANARNVIGAQWHLVSWDPRGTGNTIPFQCDVSAVAGITVPSRKRDELGNLVSTNTTEVFLEGAWQSAGQVADACYAQNREDETATLIGTAFVARDIMEIVDALDEDGLLRYYGWSYGTALGSYVAAMFPDRVESMVLDANVNPYDYRAGHYGKWTSDTDEAFQGFIQTCYNATDDCDLYTLLQPDSPQDILDAINLALTPFARNATNGDQAYLAYLALKFSIINPLYFPRTWPMLASTIAELLNGSTSAPPSMETYGTAENAILGIRSGDATFIANSTEEYLPQVEYQSTISPGFSDIAYWPLWISAQWRIPARERYWGVFKATTKTPILYINGEFDPATPLVNAYTSSKGFEGSVVLPHSGYGHGIFADPSECVARYVRAYFKEGTLPDGGTRCEPDQSVVEVWRSAVRADEAAENSSTTGGSNATSSATPAATNGAGRVRGSVALAIGAVVAVAVIGVL